MNDLLISTLINLIIISNNWFLGLLSNSIKIYIFLKKKLYILHFILKWFYINESNKNYFIIFGNKLNDIFLQWNVVLILFFLSRGSIYMKKKKKTNYRMILTE